MKKSKEYSNGIEKSKEHWEMRVPATAEGFGNDPKGAFLPRPGKDRAQPHEKINECDH
jgi:hypothetical protein